MFSFSSSFLFPFSSSCLFPFSSSFLFPFSSSFLFPFSSSFLFPFSSSFLFPFSSSFLFPFSSSFLFPFSSSFLFPFSSSFRLDLSPPSLLPRYPVGMFGTAMLHNAVWCPRWMTRQKCSSMSHRPCLHIHIGITVPSGTFKCVHSVCGTWPIHAILWTP